MKVKRLLLAILAIAMMVMACEKPPKPTPPKPTPPTPTTVKVTGVSLNKSSHEMTEGETVTLSATVSPSDATNKKVSWSSSTPATATVDANGKVTAVKEGTTTITVTTEDQSKTATCTITVTKAVVAVTGISLNKESITLTENTETLLEATVTPENATNKNITWSSNHPEIATVDQSGKVSAKTEGTATITATTEDGGKTATCTVTVKKATVAVTSVSLSLPEITINKGTEFTFEATIEPADATNKEVTWSIEDSMIADVDQNGKVIAKEKGTTTVTVTTVDGGKKATATITVFVPAEKIELNPSHLTLTAGDIEQISANVLPEDTSESKEVEWSSEDPTIATVASDGTITAVAQGSTTITATLKSNSAITATIPVTVNAAEILVESITVIPKNTNMSVGDVKQLKFTITPEDATNKEVTWESSSPLYATVDENGIVTAVAQGASRITATTANGKTASCMVKVNPAGTPVTSVYFNTTSTEQPIGATFNVVPNILPENATDKSITFSSSDPSVASIDQDGLLKTLSAGITTITATAHNGKQGSFELTVLGEIYYLIDGKIYKNGTILTNHPNNVNITDIDYKNGALYSVNLNGVYKNNTTLFNATSKNFGSSYQLTVDNNNDVFAIFGDKDDINTHMLSLYKISSGSATVVDEFWNTYTTRAIDIITDNYNYKYILQLVEYKEDGVYKTFLRQWEIPTLGEITYKDLSDYAFGSSISYDMYGSIWTVKAAAYQSSSIQVYSNGSFYENIDRNCSTPIHIEIVGTDKYIAFEGKYDETIHVLKNKVEIYTYTPSEMDNDYIQIMDMQVTSNGDVYCLFTVTKEISEDDYYDSIIVYKNDKKIAEIPDLEADKFIVVK